MDRGVKRRRFSLEEKVEILKEVDVGVKKADIAPEIWNTAINFIHHSLPAVGYSTCSITGF
jgi:hypothetical protein